MVRTDAALAPLGTFIREQRTRLDLTQTELGDRVGWVQARISLLENGQYGMPSLPRLAGLASALHVPFLALLGATGYINYDGLADSMSTSSTDINAALQNTLQRLLAIEATTLADALNQASDHMADALDVEKIDAFVLDASSRSLVALGTSNTPMGRLQHECGLDRLPLVNRGRTVEVYLTGEAFCTGSTQNDSGISLGVKETLGVRSMMAVPMRADGVIHGVLVAESRTPHRFTGDDQRFFAAAAHWVGMIARRVELTETVRHGAVEEARLVAADEVITALAHDLGNALTPLKGRLDLLRDLLSEDGQERELKQAMGAVHAVSTIQAMMARLLDSARLDQGLFSLVQQPVDLANLIEQAVESMRPSWDSFEVHVPDTLDIRGDSVRLTEVLVNLLTNAVQHAPPSTPIIVVADSQQRANRHWAVVRVTDQGPGIPPKLMPRLFQRFAPGSGSTGLGLGLYLSRRIVEAHGGTLTAESSEGKGTTFWVAIPGRAQ
jgi:two-component system OmpR family sensor kinase